MRWLARPVALTLAGLVLLAGACFSASTMLTAGARDAGALVEASPSNATTAALPPDCGPATPDWPMFGRDECNGRAADPSAVIGPSNASSLHTIWSFDTSGEVSATPAIVEGSVYFPDWAGRIYRLDAATGTVVWAKSISDLVQLTDDAGNALQDIGSRTTPLVTGNVVVFGTMRQSGGIVTDPAPAAMLVAIDKDTAAVQWRTSLDEGHPAAVITSSPVLDGERIYVGVSSAEEGFPTQIEAYVCCSFRGSVAAVDLATGTVVWQTHTIRDDVYYESDGTTRSGYAGAAVWSTPTIDRNRGQIYITTGDDYSVPASAASSGMVVDGNAVDSIVALDMETGAVRWARPLGGLDVFNYAKLSGPDVDFGAGANLFSATIDGTPRDLVGAGQKSGVYWALDPDTGNVVWATTVGPGGHLGGIHWGTATDGQRIYVGVNDQLGTSYVLGGAGAHAGETTHVGGWAALDPTTGSILWQVANPAQSAPLQGASVNGPVTVANGVVFGGSMDGQGTMFALDATTGATLWSFASGGTVYGGPAVAGNLVVWGAGYPASRIGFGTSAKKIYAFAPDESSLGSDL